MSRRKQSKPLRLIDEDVDTPGEVPLAASLDTPGAVPIAASLDTTQHKDLSDHDSGDDFPTLVIDTTEYPNSSVHDRRLSGSSDNMTPNLSSGEQSRSDMENTGNNSEEEMTSPYTGGYDVTDAHYVTNGTHFMSAGTELSNQSAESITTKPRQSSPSKTRRKSDKILPVPTEDGQETFTCPVCKEVLPNNHELTRHIRSHNTSTVAANTCTICGKLLSSQSSLDRHMLVHSGERPFKCRHCNMAFTTNGNMHRHSRIHEKEMNTPIRISASPRQGRGGRKRTTSPQFPENGLPSKANSVTTDKFMAGVKRKLDSEINYMSPTKRFIECAANVSRMDEVPTEQDTSEVSPSTKIRPENQDNTSFVLQQRLKCHICEKIFPSRNSLDQHIAELHSTNSSVRCHLCKVSFRNARGLFMHQLLVHQRNKVSLPAEKLAKSDTVSKIPVGFHELGFSDFSSEKFSLIAKAWCEANQRSASSEFHQFICYECDRAFPCASALQLHLDTHPPELDSTCSTCDCNFPTRVQYENHVLSHYKDDVIACYGKTPGADDNDLQDVVSKNDFLLVLGMRSSKPNKLNGGMTVIDSMQLSRLRPHELRTNDDYYAKLEQNLRLSHAKGTKGSFSVFSNGVNHHDTIPASELLSRPLNSGNHGNSRAPAHKLAASAYGPSICAPLSNTGHTVSNGGHSATTGLLHPDIKQEIENESVYSDEQDYPTGSGEERDSNGLIHCRFCTETFSNYRTFKGHERGHLGLSPYKCNLCSYSSTDKSTLIRHLRTHNGERPFQCMVCDFAFTTKANCERHVRKKHGKETKEEIELSIGYNQFIPEGVKQVEDFGSPDTVCKYCGKDFKFFRALKHHLRSHSSCRYKPFVCKVCANGFSTKANCVRHIQKQHLQIQHHQLEKNIQVNEVMMERLARSEMEDCPESEESRAAVTPPVGSSYRTVSQALHAPPLKPVSSVMASSNPQPSSRPKPVSMPVNIQPITNTNFKTYITTPPIAPIKREPVDPGYEQPLDFSLKTSNKIQMNGSTNHYSMGKDTALNLSRDVRVVQDQPIDLSLSSKRIPEPVLPAKKPEQCQPTRVLPPACPQTTHVSRSGVPILPTAAPSPASLPQTGFGLLRFKKDYQKFYNRSAGRLQCPYCDMLFKHGLKLLVHMRTHTNERPYQCDFCLASFTIKNNLDRHLKTRHPQEAEKLGINSVDLTNFNSQYDDDDVIIVEPNNNQPKLCQTNNCGTVGVKSPVSNYGSDNELASVNKIIDATNHTHFQAFFRNPDDSQSPRKTLMMSPLVGFKKEEPRDVQTYPGNGEVMQDGDNVEYEDEADEYAQSEDESQDEGSDGNMTGGDPMQKKKRNSYADSPHRLKCPYCPRAFPWISSLKRHLLTHTGQKPFKCPQCPVTFSTKSNRERHMIRKHGLNVHDPATRQMMDRPFKCHLCVFSSFATAGNLLRHYREKHRNKEIPDGVVPSGMSAEEFEKMDFASDNISYNSDMSEDKMMEFEEEEAEMEGLEEGVTRKLLDHNPTPRSTPECTPEPQINPERDNYNVDKITDCWTCGENFDNRKALVRHLKEHNIDLPYKCYLCDASYEVRRECVEHTISRHPADWELLREKNNVSDVGEFVSFMEKIVCETLEGKAERNSEALTRVQMEEMKPESDYAQRKVYCTLCPKRFWSLQDLRRHMRSHTGERPFECDVCHKRFTLKHSMMRHRRKHVDIDTVSLSDDDTGVTNDDTAGDVNARITVMSMKRGHTDSNRSTPASLSDLRRSELSMPTSKMNGSGGSSRLDQSNILQNLLGVENSAIDQMLSTSADNAAKLLGL